MSATSSMPRVSVTSPVLLRPAASLADTLWTNEGVSGVCQNQLTGQLARRVAGAFATNLLDQGNAARPSVILASDSRPLVVELVAATAESIRWCGCDVIEMGEASTAGLMMAIRKFHADGGILIGNEPSESHTGSLSFFGAAGKPLSRDGGLNQIRMRCDQGYARPVRTAGSLQRGSIEEEYQAAFEHSLGFRRLSKIVFDSACGPLTRRLKRFLPAECQLIGPQTLPVMASPMRKPVTPGPSFRQSRERMIARQVIADAAEFGIWIDGNGEACTVIDDRGLPISPQSLIALLGKCPFDEVDQVGCFFENETREAAYAQLVANKVALAGDSQGRVWHRTPGGAHQVDALYVLARLIALLEITGLPLRKLL